MTYDNDNVFSKILRGEIPCNEVYQDDDVLAFHDISKAAPVHVLVIPKKTYISFDDFLQKAAASEVAQFFEKVHHIARQLNLAEGGYRLIMNHGADASQTVHHFHLHILGGRALGGLLPDDPLTR